MARYARYVDLQEEAQSGVSERYFDTNIVIDMLHNRPAAWDEVRNVTRAWISRMTWIEVMAGVPESAAAETEEFQIGRAHV